MTNHSDAQICSGALPGQAGTGPSAEIAGEDPSLRSRAGTGATAALAKAEARLPRWMALCAVAGFAAAVATGRFRFAGGLALGAALAVVAYRWLHQGIAAALGAGQGDASGRVPKSMVFKLVIRYPLAFGVVYLFYETRWLPFEGVLAGLFVPVGGVLVECLFQLGGAVLERSQKSEARSQNN